MDSLASFLEHALARGFKDRPLKEGLAKAILEVCGETVQLDDISIKNGEVVVRTDPSLKSKIMSKQYQIIKTLSRNFPGAPKLKKLR